MAANAQLDGARSLLEHGRYQGAYAMLSAPQMQAMPFSRESDLLRARAALETGNTAQARALYTALLESGADDVQAAPGLGRAYPTMGEYARAKYGLKTMLQLDELPPCLAGQAQVYADTAQESMAGKRRVAAGFLQLRGGGEQPSIGADNTFLTLRSGINLLYRLDEKASPSASLDSRALARRLG